jgi:hypothetical protein
LVLSTSQVIKIFTRIAGSAVLGFEGTAYDPSARPASSWIVPNGLIGERMFLVMEDPADEVPNRFTGLTQGSCCLFCALGLDASFDCDTPQNQATNDDIICDHNLPGRIGLVGRILTDVGI